MKLLALLFDNLLTLVADSNLIDVDRLEKTAVTEIGSDHWNILQVYLGPGQPY